MIVVDLLELCMLAAFVVFLAWIACYVLEELTRRDDNDSQ